MSKRVLKRIGLILAVVVIILLGLVHILPININRTIVAQRANMLTPYIVDEVTILITGTYRINLFGRDSFEGRIEIEGYRITENSQVSIFIDRSSPATLVFRDIYTWRSSILGEFRASRLFRDFDIIVYNGVDENVPHGYINLQNDNNMFVAYSRRWRNNDSLQSRYHAFMDILRESMD